MLHLQTPGRVGLAWPSVVMLLSFSVTALAETLADAAKLEGCTGDPSRVSETGLWRCPTRTGVHYFTCPSCDVRGVPSKPTAPKKPTDSRKAVAPVQAGTIPSFAYFLNLDAAILEAYFLQCEALSRIGDLKCKIVDISIAPGVNQAKANKQREEADVEAQKLLADKDGLTQMCSVQPQLDQALRQRSDASAVRFWTGLNDLCTKKSLGAARDFVLKMIEHAERTCVIGTGGGWETTFAKRGPHTWVANNGPEGNCGRVTIETLEEDPTKPLTWYYTIRKATTAPNNDPICKIVPDSTMKYEWSVNERAVTCEAVKFGVP